MNHSILAYHFRRIASCIVLCFIVFQFSCTTSYSPPATQGSNHFLVVDGLINTGPDSTIFNLSNTTNLGDSVPPAPEIGAAVIIEGNGGYSNTLVELGNGRYGAAALNVDPSQQYRVRINTPENNQYLSDYVPILQTPPIDSVSWVQQNQGVQIFVTTHDPQNLVNYYQWQFAQTWEYHAGWDAGLIFENGSITGRSPSQQVYSCWSQANSTDILVGSSANLSQRIVYEQPLTSIPAASIQLSVEYSILVKQFALTKDAYTFWDVLKTNTEELGSLFGPQPSELVGNIQCTNNPTLPVLGYISAANVQQQRIFISNSQLNSWGYTNFCPDSLIPVGGYYPLYYDQGFVPIYIEGLTNLYITGAPCADCTLGGGVTLQPLFWP